MFQSNGDILVKYEHYKDLIREVESERLIGATGLQPFNPWLTTLKITQWLGSQMVKWGKKLQDYGPAPLPGVSAFKEA